MLSKIYAFQRLMLFSSRSPFEDTKKTILGFVFMVIMLITTLSILGFYDQNIFIYPVGSILLIYSILQSDDKLYELVPVSPKFTVANIYLFSITAMVIMYLALMATSLLFIGFLLLIVLGSGASIQRGEAPEGAMPLDSMPAEGVVFLILIFILIIFMGTTISIIKNDKIRYISIGSALAVLFGFLYTVKLSMPMPSLDDTTFNYVRDFGAWNGNTPILLGLGIFTLIAVPLSVKIGYKIYTTQK